MQNVHQTRTVTTAYGELFKFNVNNPASADNGAKAAVHINERFAGRFRRVVSLSDDVDPDSTKATYSDGVLVISIKRRTTAQSRRINIQ